MLSFMDRTLSLQGTLSTLTLKESHLLKWHVEEMCKQAMLAIMLQI